MQVTDLFDMDIRRIVSVVQSVAEEVSRKAASAQPFVGLKNGEHSYWVEAHLFGSCGLRASTVDSDVDLYV